MNIKVVISLVACLCSFVLSWAIPAKPGIIDYVQPDGRIVKIRIFGDENAHYYTSDDGYPLIASEDTLFFAQLGELNEVTFSKYIAKNFCDRDDSCNAFLGNIDKNSLLKKLNERSEFSRQRAAAQNGPGNKFGLFPDASFPTQGENRSLVVLVEFSDVAFDNNYNAHEYFDNLLNQSGFSELGAYGSARDYFCDNSSGLFRPVFDVKGPVRLSKPEAYYGANGREQIDLNAGKMIIEVCRILDNEIDFSDYDCDNDGKIDNVFVFYAGKGEASGGSPMTIWPHSSDVKYFSDEPVMLDGKILGRYACSNEIMKGRPDGIGTFVHEFCHVMGLPDLYSTTYTEAFTLGAWDIMDSGSYNNDSMTPPLLSSFEREALGWSRPSSVVEGTNEIEPLGIMQSGYEYIIDENEKYYLETRCRAGWDSFIPGEGLLLWHVNYSPAVWANNRVNVLADKQYVDLVEADGLVSDKTRSGDCFPGTSNISYVSVVTHPSLQPWSENAESFVLNDIIFNNGIVSFDFSMNCESYYESYVPVFNDDCLISDDSLEVSWLPVSDAHSYNVDVKEVDESEVVSETLDFDSGLRGIPQEWEVKFGLPSNGIINPENKTSMLGLMQNGGITSPRFDKDLSQLSFSVMAYGSEGHSATIELCAYKNGEWAVCNKYSVPVSQALTKVHYAFEMAGIKEFKLVCSGETGVITFIDDLTVECYDTAMGASLSGFPLNDYTQTQITVEELKPATGYIVCVSSNVNERRSMDAIKRIATNENSALNSVVDMSQSDIRLKDGHLTGYLDEPQMGIMVSFDGRVLGTFQMSPGYNSIDVRRLEPCVIVVDGHVFKIMSR